MDNLIVKTTNKEEAISEIIKIYQKEDVVLQELLEDISLPDLSIMDVVEVYAALSSQIDGDDIVRLNYEDKIICSLALSCRKTASEADKTMLKQYKSKED